MNQVKVGIIGGSGLNKAKIFETECESQIQTPFGNPSDTLREGHIDGVPCVSLARHGWKHSIMPTNVNYRANIWALKERGCTHVIASTACGSLQEHIKPYDFVIVDQFIDRTTKRAQTFYDGEEGHPSGILHLPMDTPFCTDSSKHLERTCKELGYTVHPTGTIVTTEGPRFSTKAESRMFHQWGGDVISMTTVPEVILARELGMSYAALAMVTDYDCWKEGEETVNVERVIRIMKMNAEKAVMVFRKTVSKIAAKDCSESVEIMKKSVEKNIMKAK